MHHVMDKNYVCAVCSKLWKDQIEWVDVAVKYATCVWWVPGFNLGLGSSYFAWGSLLFSSITVGEHKNSTKL